MVDKEIEALKKELEAEKSKNMKKLTPVPEEQKALPKSMQDGDINTSVKKMSEVVENALATIRDLGTMEILLEPSVRLKNRLNHIKELSSAKNHKIGKNWYTEAPKIHIRGLTGRKISNDICEVFFEVYDMDEKGNKKAYPKYVDRVHRDGSVSKVLNSEDYKIRFEITETIKRKQPIKREIIENDLNEE